MRVAACQLPKTWLKARISFSLRKTNCLYSPVVGAGEDVVLTFEVLLVLLVNVPVEKREKYNG